MAISQARAFVDPRLANLDEAGERSSNQIAEIVAKNPPLAGILDQVLQLIERQSAGTLRLFVEDGGRDEQDVEDCRLTAPILSTDGARLGMAALEYEDGTSPEAGDEELLRLASRLAAMAIEQVKLTDRLEFEARHDALTGLSNRSHFVELLQAALAGARREAGVLAVLFIDLDRFKQINDTLGHALGDQLLKEVGARLKRLLAPGDLAGRMGGDEFTIVLTHQPDEDTALETARLFLNVLRAPYRMDGTELYVTASIGVAVLAQHGDTAAELLRNADLAMYQVKNSGKNDLQAYQAENHVSGLERLRLETALRRALENREFDLRYQPVMNIDGSVSGLEALLAWKHPVYGAIPPKQFIPIAEETGLIIPIGSWVIRQACLDAARWHKAGHRFERVSVNISAIQLERRDFLENVAAALAISGLPPERLELELTESAVMRDVPQAASRMSHVRELGVSISIDDFGTGYSSLSYLVKLPVDSLKIDQSFLRSLQQPDGSLPVIQGIVRLAHSMNLTVVAEGVETAAELDLVRLLGCDRVQGHLYGPSLSREAAEELLARGVGLRRAAP